MSIRKLKQKLNNKYKNLIVINNKHLYNNFKSNNVINILINDNILF